MADGPPAVLELQVDGVPLFLQHDIFEPDMVEVGLGGNFRGGGEDPVPAAYQVAPRNIFLVRRFLQVGGGQGIQEQILVDLALVEVPLQGKGIFRTEAGIQPKAGADHLPVITGVIPVQMLKLIPFKGLGVDTTIGNLAQGQAVTGPGKALFLGSRAQLDKTALGIGGMLGDDVDHPVDGIGSPQGRAGTADDLDPLDILQQDVLHFPVNPGKSVAVNAAAIDQDQQFVGEAAVGTAAVHRPLVGVDARDVEAGHHAQGVRDVGHPGLFQVFVGDDEDGRGAVGEALALAADRGHLDTHQIFEAQFIEIAAGRPQQGGGGRHGQHEPADHCPIDLSGANRFPHSILHWDILLFYTVGCRLRGEVPVIPLASMPTNPAPREPMRLSGRGSA